MRLFYFFSKNFEASMVYMGFFNDNALLNMWEGVSSILNKVWLWVISHKSCITYGFFNFIFHKLFSDIAVINLATRGPLYTRLLSILLEAIYKRRPADPGGGGCGIRRFNCHSSVILLFYPDAGGRGV